MLVVVVVVAVVDVAVVVVVAAVVAVAAVVVVRVAVVGSVFVDDVVCFVRRGNNVNHCMCTFEAPACPLG